MHQLATASATEILKLPFRGLDQNKAAEFERLQTANTGLANCIPR